LHSDDERIFPRFDRFDNSVAGSCCHPKTLGHVSHRLMMETVYGGSRGADCFVQMGTRLDLNLMAEVIAAVFPNIVAQGFFVLTWNVLPEASACRDGEHLDTSADAEKR
jgi:hypothetical protein